MKKLKLIGGLVLLLGVTGIVSSQAVKFRRTEVINNGVFTDPNGIGRTVEDLQTKNIVLFCGVALVLAGSGCIALGRSKIVHF